MTDLICYDCLTEDNQHVPAVTTVSGTAVCEKCARERAEIQSAGADLANERQQQIFDQLAQAMAPRKPI